MAGVVAAIGLGIAAIGTGMSFAQAGQQRKAQAKAEREAAMAMAAARKKLEVNYLDALGIQKEPYELEREALLVAGAQGVEAARESERGAAAGVGRIQLAQQKGQQGIRSAMGQEMTALDRAAAAEESRLRDVGVQLDLGEVAGAQMAASDASQAAAAAQSQGFQQLASLGAQALEAAPLFSKSPAARAQAKAQRQAIRADKAAYMEGAGKGKGFLGLFTGYNKLDKPGISFTPSSFGLGFDANVYGGKDFALANLQKKQFSAFDANMINRINKAGLSTDGEQIGQDFDLEAIQAMSPQELRMFMAGLTPGQTNLINQAIGLY
jgi:hypothetical protein